MSQRMVCIPKLGFMEYPPASKATPLPTRAIFRVGVPFGVYFMWMKRGLRLDLARHP